MAKAKAIAKSKTASSKNPPAKASEKPSKAVANAGKKAVREREKKKQQLKRKRYLSGSLAIIIIGGGLISYQQRLDQIIVNYVQMMWINSTKAAGFTFEELTITKKILTPPEDVYDAIGISFGDSLFAQSLNDIHHRLLGLEMVKNAHVSRNLSTGQIIVQLIERKPFALWQYRDKLRVIDNEGVVLMRANPDNYPELITVVGENAPSHMNELISFLMSEKELVEEVVAAVYVSNRRWDVHFVSGVQIMLPEENPTTAWKKLAKMQKKENILSQKLQAIDLRIENKMFLTLPDETDGTDTQNASGASDI